MLKYEQAIVAKHLACKVGCSLAVSPLKMAETARVLSTFLNRVFWRAWSEPILKNISPQQATL
jgi:hypothetical protein